MPYFLRVTLIAAVVAMSCSGCMGTNYLPQVRENYATAVLHQRVYVHIIEPTVKAISLVPPFECDARTVALAQDGLPPQQEAPTAVKFFPKYDSVYWQGVYAVITVAGLSEMESASTHFREGPVVYVITGDDSDHPAMSALNVVNRYNAVVRCLQSQP